MRLLRSPRVWGACLAGWALLALSEGTALHIDAQRDGRASQLGAVLFERGLSDLPWVAVAGVVFAVMQRVTASAAGAARIATRSALLGLALAPLYLGWPAFARTVVRGGGYVEQLRLTAGTTVLWDGVLYSTLALTACMIFVAQRARQHERDGAELRTRLAQAELELLRAQLEPHFLFNALNTIAGLIRGARLDLATAALAKLSELLRYVVEASGQYRVPRAWELEFTAAYLELRQLRSGPRLQFAIHDSAPRGGCGAAPLVLPA